MNYEIVTLDEISEKIDYGLTTSATSSDTGIKFLRITDIQENGVDWQSVPFCECNEKDLKKYSLARGDIVFARTGATTGKSFLIKDTPEKTVFASYLIRVRSNQKLVDPDFLSCFFQTPQYWQQISDSAVGAAQVGVNGSKLAELKLPLPPLTEQKRIASLLARADRLRQLRRTAHDLGDALLQSVFLEMFGGGKWERTTLGEICSLIRDGTHVTPTYVPSGIPFVTVKNITSGHLDFSVTKFISEEEHKKISKGMKPERGDILVSKDGTIGIPCPIDTDKEFSIFVSVALLKPVREKVNTNFLVYQIGSKVVQDQIEDSTKGIAIRHLHLEDFKRLKVILPPLSLQEEFAGVVARVESLRGRMSEAGRQVNGLFEGLLGESFGGIP